MLSNTRFSLLPLFSGTSAQFDEGPCDKRMSPAPGDHVRPGADSSAGPPLTTLATKKKLFG